MKAFFKKVINQGISIHIISHKTRYPYAGPRYDLHAAAYQWLEQQEFFSHVGMKRENVYFVETKINKCKKIADVNCTHFIDDLPEFLLDDAFPSAVEKILFSPEKQALSKENSGLIELTSWNEINSYLFENRYEHS
jgi:hypothetical protein